MLQGLTLVGGQLQGLGRCNQPSEQRIALHLDFCDLDQTRLDQRSQLIGGQTAGFTEHPATLLTHNNRDDSEPLIMVERSGVVDADISTISGRNIQVSAINNLLNKNSSKPDLIISNSTNPVPEYDNPSLFPGMYPTLFPFGIGGFDDSNRDNELSLQQQANYYFEIADREFRYHHSFMFVVLNIYQRRLAHLHTSLTVRKSHFKKITVS